MQKFRKKPVVVQAEAYRPGLEDGFGYWSGGHVGQLAVVYDGLGRLVMPNPDTHGPLVPVIVTLEGPMAVSEDDVIVTGVRGERYPVKPEIFAATYEPA